MILRPLATIGLALILCGPATARAQGDAKIGAQKIRTLQCVSCHGRDGLSKLPGAPNLAGQAPDYLTGALAAYKDGSRKNEIMSVVAGKLSDADMSDLAAYYAAIEIHVTPPPKP